MRARPATNLRDESDPNNLDPDGNGGPCEDPPVLASNVECVEAGGIAVSGDPPAARPSSPTKALAGALVVPGVLALYTVWRRGPAEPG